MPQKPATLLDNSAALAAREAMLGEPHMVALEEWRLPLSTPECTLPHFDPLDGGADARLLILLETPGPGAAPLRFVSCDNPTGTARNLRRFLAEAGIARREVVLWNTIPSIIHAPGARNRVPKQREIVKGLALLPAVVEHLPRLRCIVLAGRIAALACPMLKEQKPAMPVITMPHPSPTYVCTSPDVPVRTGTALRLAASWCNRWR